VVVGAVAMFSPKGRGRHSSFGTVYYWCLLALFMSATFLSVLRWAENYHLGLFDSHRLRNSRS
jgi:hypothetical protein